MKKPQPRNRSIFSGILLLALLVASGLAYRLCWTHYGRWLKQAESGAPRSELARMVVDGLDALYAAQLRLRPNSRVSDADGMLMLYVPAGEFTMGGDRQLFTQLRHEVYLDTFWIDSTEVSNKQYALCVQTGACVKPEHFKTKDKYLAKAALPGDDFSELPVVYVVWNAAVKYCHWVGRRLPTEAEWEKAAHNKEGRIYPWGKRVPNANLLNYDDNYDGPLPVGRYPFGASPFGALNMAGNVREWVADWYSESYYYYFPDQNPTGPQSGVARVLRGGAFNDTKPRVGADNRFKHDPVSPGYNRGFRCAMSR